MQRIVLVVIVLVLAACSSGPSDAEIQQTVAAAVDQAVPAAVQATVDAIPTQAPPTAMPIPTDTPTATPRPTSTPSAGPISISGSGDSIESADTGGRPSIAHITYTGGSNFVVRNYDASGERIKLLVNTIGAYDGTVGIDLRDDEHTTRFGIESSGSWTIEVLPLNQAREAQIPEVIEGNGDDVVLLRGDATDLMTVDASLANGTFSIWGFYDDLRYPVIYSTAPYTGTVLMLRTTHLLTIEAEGPWSLDITSP